MDDGVTGVDEPTAELASVQSAAKWLVAAAAGIAAVLFTGVQVTSVTKLSGQGVLPVVVGVIAILVALVSVGVVLVLAARVLIIPGWTLNRLSHRAVHDGEKRWKPSWLREELEGQRGLLVPDNQLKLGKLYRQHHELLKATFELYEKGSVALPVDLTDPHGSTETYSADNAEHTARLQRRLDNISAAARQVAAVANLATARRRYRQLVLALPWTGALLILSVVTFVLATTSTANPVTSPTAVRIQLTSDPAAIARARLPPACTGLALDAVAIGGSLDKPSVVSLSNPRCVLRQQVITADLGLAVPLTAK